MVEAKSYLEVNPAFNRVLEYAVEVRETPEYQAALGSFSTDEGLPLKHASFGINAGIAIATRRIRQIQVARSSSGFAIVPREEDPLWSKTLAGWKKDEDPDGIALLERGVDAEFNMQQAKANEASSTPGAGEKLMTAAEATKKGQELMINFYKDILAKTRN